MPIQQQLISYNLVHWQRAKQLVENILLKKQEELNAMHSLFHLMKAIAEAQDHLKHHTQFLQTNSTKQHSNYIA